MAKAGTRPGLFLLFRLGALSGEQITKRDIVAASSC